MFCTGAAATIMVACFTIMFEMVGFFYSFLLQESVDHSECAWNPVEDIEMKTGTMEIWCRSVTPPCFEMLKFFSSFPLARECQSLEGAQNPVEELKIKTRTMKLWRRSVHHRVWDVEIVL
jgi:hypothetical protein